MPLFENCLNSAASLLAKAGEKSSLVKYGISTLEKSGLNYDSVLCYAKNADSVLSHSLEKVQQAKSSLAIKRADLTSDNLRAYVVDSQWFVQVQSILQHRDEIFQAAAASFHELKNKNPQEFIMALQTRLQTQFNESMVSPLMDYYVKAMEKYGKISADGSIDYSHIRAELGAAWESQVMTAYATHVGAPAARLYDQCVLFYNSLRQQQAELKPQELIAAMQHRMGSVWDESLREPLTQWLNGAKLAADEDLATITKALDYDNDGKLTANDAVLAGRDLMSYLYQASLSTAQHYVDYILPESVVVSDDSAQVALEGHSQSFVELRSVISSRVQAKLQTNFEKLKEFSVAKLKPYVPQVDVLQFAEEIVTKGKQQVNFYLSSPALQEALSQAQHSLVSVRAIIESSQLAQQLSQQAGGVKVAVAALLERAQKAATLARQYVSGLSFQELSHTSLSFLAQSVGVQPKDQKYEETLAHLQSLLLSLRQIVVLSTSASSSVSDSLPQPQPQPEVLPTDMPSEQINADIPLYRPMSFPVPVLPAEEQSPHTETQASDAGEEVFHDAQESA